MTEIRTRSRARVVLVVDGHQLPLTAVSWVTRCDLSLVDDVLRLQLAAKRRGWSVRLVDASPNVVELMGLVGQPDLVVDAAASDLPVR